MLDAVIFHQNKCPDCLSGYLELYNTSGVPMGFLGCLEKGSLNGSPSFFKCDTCNLFFDLDWTDLKSVPKPLTYIKKLERFLEANYAR